MTKRDQILDFLEDRGVIRARELREFDITPAYLSHLAKEGVIQRLERGVYAHPDFEITEQFELIVVQKRVPRGVFCLLTALQFHEMTTQLPSEVDLAIKRSQRDPKLNWPPLNIFHISENQFAAGIEDHELDAGPTLRVYSPARTVADCFKFRNHIGLDVALEGLREYWNQGESSADELMKYADICRVRQVIRPYLEAMI